MTLSLSQTYRTIGPGLTSSFLGAGGTPPYVYSLASGSSGFIDSSTGVYTAPTFIISTGADAPRAYVQTVIVTDSASATAEATITIADSILIFIADIIQGLALSPDHVYLWDQKMDQPKDQYPYFIIGQRKIKPFGNVSKQDNEGHTVAYTCNLYEITIDVIGRNLGLVNNAMGVLPILLKDTYSQQQQEKNSFFIAPIPLYVLNYSDVDGAAIPYRYQYIYNAQYSYALPPFQGPYFDQFSEPEVTTDA